MKVIATRGSGGLYHVVPNGISLKEEQWNSIDYAMEKLGRQKAFTKAQKFFAPIDVIGAANAEKTVQEGDKTLQSDRYMIAFPQALSVYQNRFWSKDLASEEACMSLSKAISVFQCTQFQLKRDCLQGNTLSDGMHAYRDYVLCESKTGFTHGAECPIGHPTEIQFERKLTSALNLCHAWISYNPFVANRVKAFEDLMEFYDECVKIKFMSEAKWKNLMMARGMSLWVAKKLKDMKSGAYYVGNHFNKAGNNVFQDEKAAMNVFRAFLRYYGSEVMFVDKLKQCKTASVVTLSLNDRTSLLVLPKRKQKDLLTVMKTWLHDPLLDQRLYARFHWLDKVELSPQFQSKQQRRKQVRRMFRSAIIAVLFFAAPRVRVRRKIEAAKREEEAAKRRAKLLRFANETVLPAINRLIEFVQLKRKAKTVLMALRIKLEVEARKKEQERLERLLTQNEREWLNSWMDPKKGSIHITVRQQQLKEGEQCINARLGEECRKTTRIDCEDETLKKAYDKCRKDKKLSRQPTTKLHSMLKKIVRIEAKTIGTDEWKLRSDAWEEENAKLKQLEEERRDNKTVGRPFKTVWDDGEPGLRSLYVTKIQEVTQQTSLVSECPQLANMVPPPNWISLQTKVFITIRDIVESLNGLNLVTTPSYTHRGSIMAGCKEFGVVTDEALMVGTKLFMFRPEWDNSSCLDFLRSWLPPALVPTFHVYLEAFFELASNPEGKQFIFLHLIKYGTRSNASLKDDNLQPKRLKDHLKQFTQRECKSSEIVATAARQLFEQYADVMLLKTCPIKRHEVSGISEKTDGLTLEQLEDESVEFVRRTPKTYFNFRHQHPLNAEGHWKFDADQWLKEKDMGSLGYFHPTKNLKSRGEDERKQLAELDEAWKKSNLEAILKDPTEKQVHEDILAGIHERGRPTAAVTESRKRKNDGNQTPPDGKRLRFERVTPSPYGAAP